MSIKTANRKLAAINHYVFTHNNISPDLRINKIYKMCIRPVLEYAQQVIIYDDKNRKKLENLQNRILNTCLKTKIKNELALPTNLEHRKSI